MAESRDLLERAGDASDEQRRDLHGEVWRLLCNHRVAVGLLCSRHGLDCVFNPYMEARLLKGGTRMIPRVVTPACLERMVGGLLEKIRATVARGGARASPRFKPGAIPHRLLLDADSIFPKPLNACGDSIAAEWKARDHRHRYTVQGHKIEEARARLREADLFGRDDVLTEAGRVMLRRLGPLPNAR